MEENKILVVDDEQSLCELLCDVLVREGFQPDIAYNGREAISKLRQNHYNLMLLDLNMPDVSGLEVLKTVSQLNCSTEVIIITAYASLDSAITAVRQKAYDYITKPFQITQLLTTIRNALAKQRLSDENLKLLMDLQQRERELEKAYRYRNNLVESSADVIITTDISGKIVIFNNAAEKLTGYDRGQVIGTPVFRLFSEKQRDELTSLIKDPEWDGSINGLDILLRHKQGKDIPLSGILSLMKDGQDHLEGILMILRDLRERDRLQQQLLQSQRLAGLGQLAAGVAHELRNPLGVMNTSLYYLREKLKDSDPKIKEHLDMIKQEISQSQKIITSLLDFSRESNSQVEPVDIEETLEETLMSVQQKISAQNIKVTKNHKRGLKALANRDSLKQAFTNVILNAIDAMKDGGELGVRARNNGNRIVIEISDTGCGIPKEIMSDIYNPFFTTKQVGEGVGLGLSLTYSILERYNGTIEAESEDGKGSTFTLTLPSGEEKGDDAKRMDTDRRQ